MTEEELTGYFEAVAVDSGALMLEGAGSAVRTEEKTSNRDLVTEYDRKIQAYIIGKIRAAVPDAQFIAEESDERGDISARELFIIDPIDGTANFAHNLGYSAVSIAWYRRGLPFFGAVYNPYRRELYRAQAGGGAFLNQDRLSVKEGKLRNAVVVFGTSPYNLEKEQETFERVKGIYGKCQDIRRLGSAALDICHVAAGRVGLYFEASLSLWDYAAAGLILREAGGTLVDFRGREIPVTLEKTSVVAGHPAAVAESGLIGGSSE